MDDDEYASHIQAIYNVAIYCDNPDAVFLIFKETGIIPNLDNLDYMIEMYERTEKMGELADFSTLYRDFMKLRNDLGDKLF